MAHYDQLPVEATWPSARPFRSVIWASNLAAVLSGTVLTALVRKELTVREHEIERISFADTTPRPGFDLGQNN